MQFLCVELGKARVWLPMWSHWWSMKTYISKTKMLITIISINFLLPASLKPIMALNSPNFYKKVFHQIKQLILFLSVQLSESTWKPLHWLIANTHTKTSAKRFMNFVAGTQKLVDLCFGREMPGGLHVHFKDQGEIREDWHTHRQYACTALHICNQIKLLIWLGNWF